MLLAQLLSELGELEFHLAFKLHVSGKCVRDFCIWPCIFIKFPFVYTKSEFALALSVDRNRADQLVFVDYHWVTSRPIASLAELQDLAAN